MKLLTYICVIYLRLWYCDLITVIQNCDNITVILCDTKLWFYYQSWRWHPATRELQEVSTQICCSPITSTDSRPPWPEDRYIWQTLHSSLTTMSLEAQLQIKPSQISEATGRDPGTEAIRKNSRQQQCRWQTLAHLTFTLSSSMTYRRPTNVHMQVTCIS